MKHKPIALLVALLIGGGNIFAAELAKQPTARDYSPYVGQDYPMNIYWGDTHVHTNMSADANLTGSNTVSPEDAYRFAQGQTVTSQHGLKARLRRPLDFMVVADHAEYIGLVNRLLADDPILLSTEVGRRWNRMLKGDKQKFIESAKEATGFAKEMMIDSFLTNKAVFRNKEFEQSVWNGVAATADRFNQPGKFTTFSGYEWSSHPEIDNLHRVVIFKDGYDKVSRITPFSAFDSNRPEDLWRFLASYEKATGGEVIAIPHNPNASNGLMFSLQDSDRKPLTRAYAETRSRWEPLLEVTQIKGDSESHPKLSPNDEFAGYETWDKANLLFLKAKEDWMLKHEYARSALKLGLQEEQRLGINPFKFGMIGSSDAHTGLAGIDEDNFWGKVAESEPAPDRWQKYFFKGEKFAMPAWRLAASGLAAVWARENTREALFAAMKRKETYATTGPRITVRFFGGWNFDPQDARRPDLALIGYRKGVPMGADLPQAPQGVSPDFLIRAVKDPDGANLDRVQVIKGWLGKDGKTHERVFDVALSDKRRVARNGKAPPVGSSVDVRNATYTNSIGDPELAVVWKDPKFDPRERAFYYVRVLEIPTPRWTAYDAKAFSVKMDKDVTMVTQERAYTSPIWYVPPAAGGTGQ